MTRVLVVETASPKRVRRKLEDILAGRIYPEPETTLLCRDDPAGLETYRDLEGVHVVALSRETERRAVRALRARRWEVAHAFWTGERGFRRMKWLALRMGARRIEIDSGDGGMFRLTLRSLPRYWIFRLRHPLPRDHWEFAWEPPPARAAPRHAAEGKARTRVADESSAPPRHAGEEVLVIQSAEPEHVLRALQRLDADGVFRNPRYTLFCRERPEVLRRFLGQARIAEVLTHAETRGWRAHLRRLRRARYDALVLFFTGDPSYRKVKCFAFLLGVRRKYVFNENDDCFEFTWRAWLSFLARRLAERARVGPRPGRLRAAALPALVVLKVLLVPFRFLYLLLVWLRLRSAGLRPG